MARFTFGGEVDHLVVSADTADNNALKVSPNTVVSWRATPGGAVVTDFLLHDGVGFNTPATQIQSDANGYLPIFQGPDTVSVLYDSLGNDLVARDLTSTVTWSSITGKPAFVAEGTTAAAARGVIGAGVDTVMTSGEATGGTDTNARQVTAAILKTAIETHAKSNVYMMAVWNGSGAHPLRPTLPAGFFVIWRQSTAPLTTTGYALPGDEWEATA